MFDFPYYFRKYGEAQDVSRGAPMEEQNGHPINGLNKNEPIKSYCIKRRYNIEKCL